MGAIVEFETKAVRQERLYYQRLHEEAAAAPKIAKQQHLTEAFTELAKDIKSLGSSTGIWSDECETHLVAIQRHLTAINTLITQ
jgi:hypothetical protein